MALLGDHAPLATLLGGTSQQAAHAVALLAGTAYVTVLGAPVFRYTAGFRDWSLTLLAALAAGFVVTAFVLGWLGG